MSFKGTTQKIYTVREVQQIVDKLSPSLTISEESVQELVKTINRTPSSIHNVVDYYRVWKTDGTIYKTRTFLGKKIFPKLNQTQTEAPKTETPKINSTDRLDNLFEEFKNRFVDVLIELNIERLNSAYQQGYKKGKEDGEVEYRQKKISTLLQNRLNEGGTNHGS